MKRFLSVLLCAVLVLMLLPAISQTASAESLSNFNVRLNEPIASYSPDFSAEFNTDLHMYTTVTWQENSPGFNAKLNSSDEFRAGLAYKVVIWIKLGDGDYFATDIYGDLAAAITVNGKAISSLKIDGRNSQGQINEVTITCEYGPLAGREINSVMITGIPTPVEGQMPIYSFTVDSNAYSYYHTAPVVWWDMTTGKEMDSSDTFIKGHKYQVNIWIQANREGGFTFKVDQNGNPQVNVVLNGWAADTVTTAYEQDGREVIDIRYTFPDCQASHTCAPTLVPLQKQTCVMPGFKAYYECSCGKCYEDAAGEELITDMDGYGIIPADGHKEGEWSYNGTHHYKKCTTCNEVIPGTNAAHSGGTATCVEKGKCAVCNYAYLPENEDHIPDTKWTACAGLYHAKLCKLCGAHCTPEDHKPGPAATETSPQSCTVCGYIMEPAKKHTHKLTQMAEIAPTCTEPGKAAHYSCSGCGQLFLDESAKEAVYESELAIPAQGHRMSNDHGFDAQNHWYLCVVCKADMTDTREAHQLQDGKCSVCGYVAPAKSHSHKLTQVAEIAPTCTEPGKAAHYSCSGCSQLFLDESAKEAVYESELAIPAQGHRMSNDHGFDTQNHWYLCVVCKADMTDTREAHQLQDGKCVICGYNESVPTEETTAPEATEPTDTTEVTGNTTPQPTGNTTPQPTEKPQENTPKTNFWLLIVMVVLVCFSASMTTAVIILKKKKGNNHEENR